jgi:hypothetical protein
LKRKINLTHLIKSWMLPSSGIWRRGVRIWTDVSEQRIFSIFSIGNQPSNCLATYTLSYFRLWRRR